MKQILTVVTALIIVVFAACKKDKSTAPSTASVMFVNGCTAQTTSNLDGRINNVAVNGATNIAYNKNSPYANVNPVANATVAFVLSGLGYNLVSGTSTLSAGGHYSAFAGGLTASPSFVFTTDDLTPPASGNAKIRFINLSYDSLTASCYIGTTRLDSNVGYKVCTPFFEVAANTIKIAMVDQVILSNSATIPGQQLKAGKIYTFMLTGSGNATTSSAYLTLTPIANN